jgi:hypothetical protein
MQKAICRSSHNSLFFIGMADGGRWLIGQGRSRPCPICFDPVGLPPEANHSGGLIILFLLMNNYQIPNKILTQQLDTKNFKLGIIMSYFLDNQICPC